MQNFALGDSNFHITRNALWSILRLLNAHLMVQSTCTPPFTKNAGFYLHTSLYDSDVDFVLCQLYDHFVMSLREIVQLRSVQ